MQGSANLNVMIKAARKAGRSLVKDFREVENLQVSSKGAGDFVSRADIAAEAIVREELMTARPNYGWDPVEGKDPTRRWIVDPLDGTTNYLHGMPHWAVSIALEHKGEIVAAVVLDPAKDEMFLAEKGQGAWLNNARLRVSDRSRMIECIFATGIPFGGRPDLPDTLQDIARLAPACAGIRRWGAAALDLSYVAAGRLLGTRNFVVGCRGGPSACPRGGRSGRGRGTADVAHGRRYHPFGQWRDLRRVRQGDPEQVSSGPV